MEVAPAALVSILIVWFYLSRIGGRNQPRVTVAKPTTTWMMPTVLTAGAAGLLVLAFGSQMGHNLGAVVLLAAGAVFVIMRLGRIRVGDRVVYERGGRFFSPSEFIGAAILLVVVFLGLSSSL
ncbi:MAG: hypothetical protein WBM50_00695 [Acidimicrobiales bacterium]